MGTLKDIEHALRAHVEAREHAVRIHAEARRLALTEAAQIAQDRESEGGEYGLAAKHIAAAIRALISE